MLNVSLFEFLHRHNFIGLSVSALENDSISSFSDNAQDFVSVHFLSESRTRIERDWRVIIGRVY